MVVCSVGMAHWNGTTPDCDISDFPALVEKPFILVQKVFLGFGDVELDA